MIFPNWWWKIVISHGGWENNKIHQLVVEKKCDFHPIVGKSEKKITNQNQTKTYIWRIIPLSKWLITKPFQMAYHFIAYK